MITKLPKKILNYMIDNIPPFAGTFILRVNSVGKVTGRYGTHNRFLEDEVVLDNADIMEIFPFLLGIIPPPEKNFLLPNIQLPKGVYTDVHLFQENEDTIWIFFIERSQDVESIRELIQKMNETQLQEEKIKRTSGDDFCFENPFGRLDLINAVAFQRNEDGSFSLISKPTKWLTRLHPNLVQKQKELSLPDYFPFLDIFLTEAEKHWESKSDKFFNSDTWIEESAQQKEFLFKAGAISLNQCNYLILRLLNSDLIEEQSVIQKAREQQLLFEQLDKTKNKLKQLLEYKERFVSIVSHDLRSPVASVLGITDMLLNDSDFLSKLDDFNKEMVVGIHEEMKRLLDYNDKLYHWSNLELGNFELDRQITDLKELVDKAYKTFKSRIKEKKITFENYLTPGIQANIDQTLFMQVLNNLISNAVKFTGKGGKISIRAVPEGDFINFSITDTGTGMPKKIADNLFNDDLRSSTPGTYGEKGSGLGIGIIKKILDAHHYGIKVHSDIGKGTTFTITLPVIKQH